MNDKWRALGYQKAIASLKKHPRAVTSFEVSSAYYVQIVVTVISNLYLLIFPGPSFTLPNCGRCIMPNIEVFSGPIGQSHKSLCQT